MHTILYWENDNICGLLSYKRRVQLNIALLHKYTKQFSTLKPSCKGHGLNYCLKKNIALFVFKMV